MGYRTDKDFVDATVTALTGKTDAGTRVFGFRSAPVQTEEIPCILVGTGQQEESSQGMADYLFSSTHPVLCEVHGKGTSDSAWSDQVNAIVLQIKRILLNDATWRDDNTIDKISTSKGLSVEGDVRRAVAQVQFTVTQDIEYLPLEDTSIDLEKVHYTDEVHVGIEMEADTTGEE